MNRTFKGFYKLLIAWVLSLALMAGCGGGSGGGSSGGSDGGSDSGATVNLMAGALAPPETIPETSQMQYITENGTTVDIDIIKGQVVIQFDSVVPESTAEGLINSNGGDIISKVPSIQYYLVSVALGNEMTFINRMRQESTVLYVMPNVPISQNVVPNEWKNTLLKFGSWYLNTINAPAAWDVASASTLSDVEIGIIDTFNDLDKGTDDFTGRLLNGIPTTFFGNGNHGTAVAALCCSEGNNGYGNTGINWWSSVRLYSDQGNTFSALYYLTKAVNDGAKVINMSIGWGNEKIGKNDGQCSFVEKMMRPATIRGLFATIKAIKEIYPNFLVVKAAGNDDCELTSSVLKPDNLMIVGASNIENKKAAYSDYGILVDIAAPGGEDIRLLGWINYSTNSIDWFSGTSAAAPLVTGAAALVWAKEPHLTPQQVIQRLKTTANGSILEFGGAGILDVCKALGGCTSDTTPPSVPTGFTATAASSSQINLSWTASPESDVAGYKVYRNGSYLKSVTTTPTSDTGLSASTQYCYTVSAYDTTGNESSQSSQVCAVTSAAGSAPSAPTGVTATAGNGQVTISWNPVSGTDSYNIYWSTTSGVKTNTGTKITNAASPYTHTGLTNGITYYYVVTAVNSYGESTESSQVSAIPGSAPSAPTSVSATAGNGQTTISWTASTAATSYNIYWSTTSGVSKTSYTGNIPNAVSPYTHTLLTNGTTYYYVVTAVNSYGESLESSQVSATPTVATGSTIQLSKTGQTTSYATGDDGDLENGVAWPNPRFTVSGDCVTDNLTGLMWVQSPDSTTRTWQQALDYSNNLTLCGYSDWRLPNRNELKSLANNYGKSNSLPWLTTQGFSNVQAYYYWSSTSSEFSNKGFAWGVSMNDGITGAVSKSYNVYVLPVRAGQGEYASTINLPETGQTTCYDSSGNVISCTNTGQDGDIKAGVAWPSPRFTIGTGAEADCITDNLTGLMYVQSPDSTTRTWVDALTYANNLSLCGYSDWRLPNINELESLINAEQSDLATWLNTQGFSNVQAPLYWSSYWSSTTYAYYTAKVWLFDMRFGGSYYDFKGNDYRYVWPVRSGQ